MTMKHRLFAVALATGTGAAGLLAGYAIAGQPHMGRALEDLRSARAELQAAAANKAGHRERALGLVDQAIGEVQAGIAAGS